MYQSLPLTGLSLPAKTVCLTYDDGPGETTAPSGPGPRTPALARYLAEQGIRATFFPVGKHAQRYPDVVRELERLGHLVGNHTYSHPDLPSYVSLGGNASEEIRTAGLHLPARPTGTPRYFRPPYGAWSAELGEHLNADLLDAASVVGPIRWDIDCFDWRHWENGASVAAVAALYLDAIEAAGRGIVLMHDASADRDRGGEHNLTYELTTTLVPLLVQRGFRFARVDEIPEVAALSRALPTVVLADRIRIPGPGGHGPTEFGTGSLAVDSTDGHRARLRLPDGSFLVPPSSAGEHRWTSQSGAGCESELDVLRLTPSTIALRTLHGDLLSLSGEDKATLGLDSTYRIGHAHVFRLVLRDAPDSPAPRYPEDTGWQAAATALEEDPNPPGKLQSK